MIWLGSIAQSAATKINRTVSKLDSNNNAINNTTNAITNTSAAVGNMGKTIGGIFKSKKKESQQVQSPSEGPSAAPVSAPQNNAAQNNVNTIFITIRGVDYTKLKLTKDNIKSIAGVQTVDMTFNASSSSLSVQYSGKADQLWEALPENVTKMYNLTNMDGNNISAECKK
jgi:hypothetical protein